MNKRGAGVAFCAIAALLYIARYITAAIFGSGVSSWDADLFNAMLKYIGPGLLIMSIISLVVGVIYLILAAKAKEE